MKNRVRHTIHPSGNCIDVAMERIVSSILKWKKKGKDDVKDKRMFSAAAAASCRLYLNDTTMLCETRYSGCMKFTSLFGHGLSDDRK